MPAPELGNTKLDIETDVSGSYNEDSYSESGEFSGAPSASFHDVVISRSFSTWTSFRSKFYAYKWQVFFGFVIEICFCLIVNNWTRKVERMQRFEHGTDREMRHTFSILQQKDEYHVAEWMFVMLFACLFMQGWSVCLWFGTPDDKIICFPRSWASAMFIFFSLEQWVFYLWGYFFIYMEMTTVDSPPRTMITVSEVLAKDENELTDSAVQDCLSHNTSLYCRSKYTDTQVTCAEVYAHDSCTGFMETWAGNGEMIRCCVKDVYNLSPPDKQRVAPFSWTMGDNFVAMQWLGVLTMSWRLRDPPILPASAAKSGFVASAWLDLLDCVMFADNQVKLKILDPMYGIINSGDNKGGVADTEEDRYLVQGSVVHLATSFLSIRHVAGGVHHVLPK